MMLVTAFELSSGLALVPQTGPKNGPQATSELALAEKLIGQLPARSIVIADRNFGIFKVAYEFTQARHDVVLRLTKKRYGALIRKATKLTAGRWFVQWKPSREDRKSHPHLPADANVPGWVLEKPLANGQMLYLFSTMDQTRDAMADLYEKRWGAETNISQFKSTMQGESFRAKTVDMVSKELLMAIVGYNLTVQVRRLAAQKAGVEPRELSFQGIWGLVIVFYQAVAELTSEEQIAEKFEKLIELASQKKLPKRKKPRSYQRVAYAKRKKFPPRKHAAGEPNAPTESRAGDFQ